jgi:hypothetical protein
VVQLSDPQQRRWGFQMSARLRSDLVNGQAGDLKPTDGLTQVICDNGAPEPCPDPTMVQFIEHTAAATRAAIAGGVSFEFDWTSRNRFRQHRIVCAGNAANANGRRHRRPYL